MTSTIRTWKSTGKALFGIVSSYSSAFESRGMLQERITDCIPQKIHMTQILTFKYEG